jgi:hypothetical protein
VYLEPRYFLGFDFLDNILGRMVKKIEAHFFFFHHQGPFLKKKELSLWDRTRKGLRILPQLGTFYSRFSPGVFAG